MGRLALPVFHRPIFNCAFQYLWLCCPLGAYPPPSLARDVFHCSTKPWFLLLRWCQCDTRIPRRSSTYEVIIRENRCPVMEPPYSLPCRESPPVWFQITLLYLLPFASCSGLIIDHLHQPRFCLSALPAAVCCCLLASVCRCCCVSPSFAWVQKYPLRLEHRRG